MDFDNLNHLVELDQLCAVHKIPLKQLNKIVHIAGEEKPRKPEPFCPKCNQEQIKKREKQEIKRVLNNNLYLKTYNVLERDSIIPKELQSATFENYIVGTKEEMNLLTFATEQAQKYLNGMAGNTIITGDTGIGKSHLSVAMAKAINEGYKDRNEPKSVLFVNLTEIIKQIKEGWNYGKGAKLTENQAKEQLTAVDFLILDDLGAKNATISPKSDWEQDFLFDILNNRERTIINTNLNSGELKTVYNARNYSRILKGAEGNIFKTFGIQDKRFSINKLKGDV
ncbi:TPA: ATP-binding protein [Streptococcus equi subsp. zooepidemicus]|uniref:ATP-binding protein n=1 Tax=Streptococcus equi TaxID=1336 RepID=UPI001E467844|nr:ATP-binding protein [Streptococcus equi]MCD3401982.1 ATP-binding protein [Streptococcus equi subsp. zooepidemicus]HEL0661318.1 ATP-binding protein [Streptococcus equi subsp. zooepidemicus]HEL1192778.1 ATP-binding protein [Streptococcus equi subsp. zooepidemicus]